MKNQPLSDQVIVVIGASGGLGGEIAKKLSQAGARLVLAGRNMAALQSLAGKMFGQNIIEPVDLTRLDTLEAVCRKTIDQFGRVDAVIDAAGMDIRKPFEQHTEAELNQIIQTNLLGAMLVTKAFLPVMKQQRSGQIILVGGFGSGRLSFPYFSADVASRAGLAAFVETLNRELKLEDIPVTISFFSPEPAFTEAESPYYDLWRSISVAIAPTERVADEMLATLVRRESTHIMGGWSTRLFGTINDLFPGFFGKVFLMLYGKTIKNYLGGTSHESA
jgi:short-subunit dehydrogenase